VPVKSKTRPLKGQIAVVAGATRVAGAVVYRSIISA